MKWLRLCNFRVDSLHPLTTHVLCVLDVAIFKQFKGHLERFFRTRSGPVTIDNIAGMIKEAYSLATVITKDALTGK